MLIVAKRKKPLKDPAYRRAVCVDVGARIQEHKKRLALTDEKLEEKTGISRSLITRVINAKRRQNVDQIALLSKVFGVMPAALLPGGDARPWIAPAGNATADHVARGGAGGFRVTTSEQNIIAMFRSLSDPERQELEDKIRQFWELHTTGSKPPSSPSGAPHPLRPVERTE